MLWGARKASGPKGGHFLPQGKPELQGRSSARLVRHRFVGNSDRGRKSTARNGCATGGESFLQGLKPNKCDDDTWGLKPPPPLFHSHDSPLYFALSQTASGLQRYHRRESGGTRVFAR